MSEQGVAIEETNLEFGKPVSPSEYENDINQMQKRILKERQPFLPDKMSANIAVPIIKENKNVGFGFLFLRNNYADIMYMVDPSEQGKGLGMKLVQELENVAKENKIPELHSFIVDNKPQAQKAMELAGFRIKRREEGRLLYSKTII